MKLPQLNKDKATWLREFDKWVTPFLEEVRDSEIYHATISQIKVALELLGKTNSNFKDKSATSAGTLTTALMNGMTDKSGEEVFSLVTSFCDLLFLVTGKTDNNNKCQFPVFLREKLIKKTYPSIRTKKLVQVAVPRVITCDSHAKLISQLQALFIHLKDDGEPNLDKFKTVSDIQNIQKETLLNYFQFILNQPIYARSLQIFGAQYFELKEINAEDDFLAPIIIAYVRGSASASGGHKPEAILRENMHSWGLRPNEDYNVNDVSPYEVADGENDKRRAYDFVLPYNVRDWTYRIFIQSQFYAGDSGSVSHKNVDQTSNSRKGVKARFKNPLFVEYVDGAGYYSSLNGDLKRILLMDDTENFIQIRSSSLKLRQILQNIGFLTPLELIHAFASSHGGVSKAKKKLQTDGYSDIEITRVVEKCQRLSIITLEKDIASIEEVFYEKSRQYFLLDSIAVYGRDFAPDTNENNMFQIPGYGEFFGLKISNVLGHIKKIAGTYYQDWGDPVVFTRDLEYLIEQKWVELHISR